MTLSLTGVKILNTPKPYHVVCAQNCQRGDVTNWMDISDRVALLDFNFYLLTPLDTVPTKYKIIFSTGERN